MNQDEKVVQFLVCIRDLVKSQYETIVQFLVCIKDGVAALAAKQVHKEFYTTAEFAALVGKAEFTVREWCRLRRIHAVKKMSGRGKHFCWVISHDELLRFQREGLLKPSEPR